MSLSQKDLLFLEHCEAVRTESHDPDRQVGVVITSPRGHLLSTGVNRPPESLDISREESHAAIAADPNWKYYIFEHAERNAISNAHLLGHSLNGATLYGTLFPCSDCARAIVSSKIRRLVVPSPGIASGRDEKWQVHYKYAQKILQLGSILIDFYVYEEIFVSNS